MAKNRDFPYLKKFTNHRFQQVFKQILWNKDLSYGAKIYGMAILTVPPQSKVKQKKMAYKLKTDPSQISRWQKQIERAHVEIRTLEKLTGLSH